MSVVHGAFCQDFLKKKQEGTAEVMRQLYPCMSRSPATGREAPLIKILKDL